MYTAGHRNLKEIASRIGFEPDISLIQTENSQMRSLKLHTTTSFSKEEKIQKRQANIVLLHSHFVKIADIVTCVEVNNRERLKAERKANNDKKQERK